MLSKAGEFARENQPQPLFAALAAGQKAQKRPAGLSNESCSTGSPDLRSAIRKKLDHDRDNEQHTKKKVSFWPMAYVVLIPTTDEYHKAGLAPDLWWNEHDYKAFKRGALQDLQAFLLKNPHLDPKTAVKMYFHHVEDGRWLDSPLQSFHNNSVAIVPLNDSVQDSSSADQKMDKRKSNTHHHSTDKTESCVEPSPESKGHHNAVRLPEKVSVPSVTTTPSIAVTPQLSACNGSSSSSSFEVLDLFSKVASMMLGSVVQDE